MDRNISSNKPGHFVHSTISILSSTNYWSLYTSQLLRTEKSHEKNGYVWDVNVWGVQRRVFTQLLLYELWNEAQPSGLPQVWFQDEARRFLTSNAYKPIFFLCFILKSIIDLSIFVTLISIYTLLELSKKFLLDFEE